MNFEKAVDLVMDLEGGLSSNPRDHGGLTKWGISQKSYPNLDIANLTGSAAVQLYREDFWNKMQCSLLPHGLNFLVFDAAVNQGVSAATHMLQQAAGVKVDGIIGPITLKAAQLVSVQNYAARRMARYLKASRDQLDAFGLGWSNRLMEAVVIAVKDLR